MVDFVDNDMERDVKKVDYYEELIHHIKDNQKIIK